MQGMERHYYSLLLEYLSLFPCVAIFGVRQCGKTTLVNMLPKEWTFFDLENAADFSQISRDPDLFLRLHPEKTAIDEAQLLPELFPALRVAIDLDRRKAGRFVITGSSSPDLQKRVSESLAGRVAIIEMSPFSLREAHALPVSPFYSLLLSKAPVTSFKREIKEEIPVSKTHAYWFKGGYPEPYLKNSHRFSKLWMQNYVRTYLDRDIRRLFPSLNFQKYRLFLQMLSNLSGTIINYSRVARALSVSQPTARDYFMIAHGSYIWRMIPPYEKNPGKRISKHPKGILRDTGLLHFMLHQYSLQDLYAHPAMGQSWEAMVIEDILKNLNALGISFDYYYYRTGGGAEVDLILEGEFGLLPVEIKFSQNVSSRELRGLKDFIREKQCPYGVVINNNDKITLYTENIIGIPFSWI